MNIAMTAATGKVGTAILAAAGARKLAIRALVREPSRLKGPASATARFDFADRATHAPALASVDTLILISPSTPEQVLQESAVIDAARAAGVRHVIRLSGAGAEHGGNRFSDQHRAVESHLRESGLHATILRATFFMENALGSAAPIAAGTYPAPLGNARLGQIAVADIAAAALAVAVASEAQRATYTLTGPAAYTGEEIASALSEASGHQPSSTHSRSKAWSKPFVWCAPEGARRLPKTCCASPAKSRSASPNGLTRSAPPSGHPRDRARSRPNPLGSAHKTARVNAKSRALERRLS